MKLALALTVLATLTLAAQEKKPAPSAKDKAAAEARARLNKLKQDERNKELLRKAEAALKKAEQNNSAAKAEVDRVRHADELPEERDARAKLDSLKNSVDPQDMAEFEKLLKESTDALRDEYKAYREQKRNERPATPTAPAPAPDRAPLSFDHVPAPAPAPLLQAPNFPVSPPLKADEIIRGPARDPRNPDKLLPASDPRSRTLVLDGTVRIRRPNMAMDADHADIIFKEGADTSLTGSSPPPSANPAGEAKPEGSPFERIIARGRVRVMFVDRNGTVKVGRGGAMIYDEATGIFLIKEWPEAELGDKLLRGSSKDAVIKLSDIKSDDPGFDAKNPEVFTMERRLTLEDLPRTPDKPVPAAGPARPRNSPAPSPAPR